MNENQRDKNNGIHSALKIPNQKKYFAAGRIAINQSKPFGIAKAVSVDKCICLLPWVNEEGRQTDYSTSN